MDLKTLADIVVEACKTGGEAELINNYYHPDAVSVEAIAVDNMPRETVGVEGIRGKHAWWEENFELHDASVEGPFPHGDDRFAVIFSMDATHKASGSRSNMREVAVYHVADGKIVREEFFYASS